MVDFLKIDLKNYSQPADVRLRDGQEYGEWIIVQAHFTSDSATIKRLRSDRKPKEFHLNEEEMDKLCEAWTEYRKQLIAHKAAQEAKGATMIAEAEALIKSIHFDLDTLNLHLDKDSDGDWRLQIPAVSLLRYCRETEDLKEMVQGALNHLKNDVERAERYSWGKEGEWKAIVESYRKVFPVESKQGETLKVKINVQAPEFQTLPE